MTNKNIFLSCDVSSQKEIIDLLELIHEDISGIKIGLQYITQRSPEYIRELSKFNKPIFYDGKFFIFSRIFSSGFTKTATYLEFFLSTFKIFFSLLCSMNLLDFG